MADRYPLLKGGLVNAHNHWRHRIVTELVWPNDEFISTNQEAIQAIIPYSEPGQYGPTIWFEVVENQVKTSG